LKLKLFQEDRYAALLTVAAVGGGDRVRAKLPSGIGGI
jgi:hypothetical protein